MTVRYAAVWLDHKEAKVFHFHPEAMEEGHVHAPKHNVHNHAKGTRERNDSTEQQHFFHDVAKALADAQEILVLGPGTAKLELIKHVHKHEPALVPRIIGVETVDHPTDRQLVAYARQYFKGAHRTHGVTS